MDFASSIVPCKASILKRCLRQWHVCVRSRQQLGEGSGARSPSVSEIAYAESLLK